jgi:hypothetical protein
MAAFFEELQRRWRAAMAEASDAHDAAVAAAALAAARGGGGAAANADPWDPNFDVGLCTLNEVDP